MSSLFEDTVSAICYSLVADVFLAAPIPADGRCNDVVRFVLAQHGAAPVFLREPLRMLTLAFSLQCLATTGRPFHRHEHAVRAKHLRAWKDSRLKVRRDLVRFYESLAVLPWFSRSGSTISC